tara:strand:+ start:43 stop:567 length:525 start_codon:yes stop_codon:yes gene_type:complete
MIKIDCDDDKLLKVINNLFEQKNLTYKVKSDQYFVIIKIRVNSNSFNIDINDSKINIPLPTDINYFFSQILKSISNVKLSLKDYEYFPYQRLLSSNQRKSFLSDIQNTIISYLVTSAHGINKDTLYGLIWRKDKEISINKLDTHLTNLKNQLKKELDLRINFQSHDKTLRLLID